jgi:poly(A) polymerase
VEVPAADHGIDPSLVDDRAVKVVRTLQEAGYEAYVVGGAVRDLLVGLRPKDFDVATNATPEQVKALFRRAFIIGRRFRIVHVIFGRGRDHEVIEVSTFRAYSTTARPRRSRATRSTSKAELAGRRTPWTPAAECCATTSGVRRSRTLRGATSPSTRCTTTPLRQVVVDYHGGIGDVKKRVLRLIGDPVTRYREDPVRIIRAVRFAAKLGFTLEPRPRRRSRARRAAGQRAGLAAVRRDGQAAADRSCAGQHRSTAKHGPAPRRVPGPRCGVRRGPQHAAEADLHEAGAADTDRRVGEGKAGGAQLPAGLPAVARRAGRLAQQRRRLASTRCRHCSRPSTRCSTPASATSPAAASWVPTCARSG